MSKPWPYVVERGDKEITIDAPVPVWVDYDDVDQDEAKRVAALVSNAPALLAMVERYASECGECGGRGVRGPGYHENGVTTIPECTECADIRALLKSARENQS